jgi:hypothetical protein
MDKKTVTLKYPLEREGEEPIKELTIREPTGKDLKQMDKAKGGHMAKVMALIPRLCSEGVTPAELDDMCAADITSLGEVVADFMEPDGETSGD